ncbi:hypothetical protein [Actinomadura luteofluorescens]
MGIEQSSGVDTRVEGTDKPSGPDRPPTPPPDRPGQPGTPSRLESLRTAREAQLARAAELEKEQAAPTEAGTEQPDAGEDKEPESTPPEAQDGQEEPKEPGTEDETSETAAEAGEGDLAGFEPETAKVLPSDEAEGEPERSSLTQENAQEQSEAVAEARGSSELEDEGEERDTSLPEPKTAEVPGPEEPEEQTDTVDTGEPPSEGVAEQAKNGEIEKVEPSPGEATAEDTTPLAKTNATEHRPDTRVEGPRYPEIADRSGYIFTEREYAFAEVSPEEALDMQAQRVPLGIGADQWNACVTELQEALAAEGITDADVRLRGSGARFCSENPKKWFPQNEDELHAKVIENYRNEPDDERAQRADEAVAVYRAAGFSQEGPKPAAPFFDSMYKLDATDEASDYDFQIASDGLAGRFQELQKVAPDVEWRSQHGGHFKHRHLEQAAPALYDWAERWESTFDREVTLATFDAKGPASGLNHDDWMIIKPEES